MAALSNAVRPLQRFRISSACIPRRWATSSHSSPTPSSNRVAQASPKKRTPNVPPTLGRQVAADHKDLPPELLRKQWYATRLFNSGQRAIYRSPSQVGIYAASYIITGSCLLTSGFLAYSNLWMYDPASDLPWFVRGAWRLGIVVFTAMGGFVFLRSTRFIKAIDLVSVNGVVKLSIQARRPIPFLRPKEYVIAPYNFQMDRTFVQQLEEPIFMQEEIPPAKGLGSRIARAISQAIYYPIASTRRLMTLEGFMNVKVDENMRYLKLDTQGRFSNAAKDLVEMGTIKD